MNTKAVTEDQDDVVDDAVSDTAVAIEKYAISSFGIDFDVDGLVRRLKKAATPQSRHARLQLIRHLVDVESQAVGMEKPRTLATASNLISTAQAAELLGYSRPYVAMLIDQNKLKGATVSAGGHRRVSRATVLDWKAKHEVTGKLADLRSEGQKAGALKSTEADAMRRIKALAKNW
jgi:excisionase family DNA binding protein